MRIPERPERLTDLDLMRRLQEYSVGAATWYPESRGLSEREQNACKALHAKLVTFIELCVHPLMDRVTSREMEGFTMHDHAHGLKVAHLMWHITRPERRNVLSPGEIALLVLSAHLHDLGMGLSPQERRARLQEDSDLWNRVEGQPSYRKAVSALSELASDPSASEAAKADAIFQVQQAQEALLCLDTRDRHATPSRYAEIIRMFEQMHKDEPARIPDVYAALSFDGESFENKLIDICVSHNQDAHKLLDRDPTNIDQIQFPTRFPIGCCVADTRFVAAALRLSDILDFDRERTPSVLFAYLFPRFADPRENVSVREWAKHLSISNWEIDNGAIIFRGRSPSAFIHHTIIEFCTAIQEEIERTQSIFSNDEWPFILQPRVEAKIEASGYRYAPYRFSLDEGRIYELLMGRNIYHEPLDALRELIQNAVDGCKLKDALLQSNDASVVPSREGRITVRFTEHSGPGNAKILSVLDSGIGMDRYVIENFFLKVGRSYYTSSDFLQTRSFLRKRGFDYKPVSEFGIGFMAVFMLGDRVEVETALSLPIRDDTQRRLLRIDGLGRLIEITESQNLVLPRFQGTRVSVRLSDQGNDPSVTIETIEAYVRHVCRNLDYPLRLEHVTPRGTTAVQILPEGLEVPIPEHLVGSEIKIAVDDQENGLHGEIAIFRADESRAAEEALAAMEPIQTLEPTKSYYRYRYRDHGVLLRGGFTIGPVPGLPDFVLSPAADARIEIIKDREDPKILPATNLARTRVVGATEIARAIFKIWLSALMEALPEVEQRPIGSPDFFEELVFDATWLERYDAVQIYRFAKSCWQARFGDSQKTARRFEQWESGKGDPIWIGRGSSRSLHWFLLELILPKITNLIVRRNNEYYVLPPHPGWRDKLAGWTSFVRDALRWGDFALFDGEIADCLCDTYSGSRFLNSRYRERFGEISSDEVSRIISIFDELISASKYDRRAGISPRDVPLLEKAVKAADDLSIYYISRRYRLHELVAKRG